MRTNSPVNTQLSAHRLVQLSDIIREVSLWSWQWLMQQLTTDHSAEDSYQQCVQTQPEHLYHTPLLQGLGIVHFRRGDRNREEPEVRERQEQNSVFWKWQSCFTRDVRAAVWLPAQGLLKPNNIAVWGGEAFPNLHPKLKSYWQLIAARGGRINLH